MNKQCRSGRSVEGSVSRREFLGQTAAAAIGFTIVPRRVLGGAGYVPPSDKVNIAFIGVGSQGLRVMLRFLREPDVQGVAVCDPNKSSANHPQWDTHEFCNSVRKLLGVDTFNALLARSLAATPPSCIRTLFLCSDGRQAYFAPSNSGVINSCQRSRSPHSQTSISLVAECA